MGNSLFTRDILAAQAGVIDGLLQLLLRIVDERLPCVLSTVTSLYDLGVKWQEINAIPELAAMVINQSAAELTDCDPQLVCDAAFALAKLEGMHDYVLRHHASFRSSLLSAVGRVLDDVDNTQFDMLLKSLAVLQAEWPEIQLTGLADGLLQRIHDYVFQLSQSRANIAELIQCVDALRMPLDNTVGKALRTVVAIHQPVESILRPDAFSQALLALCAATDAEIQVQHCFLGIIPVTFVVANKLIITMSTQIQSTVWEAKRDGLIAAKGYAVETLRAGMDFSVQINQFLRKHRLPPRLQSRLTVFTVSQLSLFPPERQKRAREEQEPTAGPEEKRVRVASSDDQAGTDAENAAVLTLKRN